MTNFRRQFVTKCVGVGEKTGTQEASETELMDVLTGTADVDLFQLRAFVWRHTIPFSCRPLLYRTLLGISSPYPETRQMIDKQRKDEGEVLARCLVQIRQFEGQAVESDDEKLLLKPTTDDIVRMVLLADDELRSSCSSITDQKMFSPKSAEEKRRVRQIAAIARQIALLKEKWWDTFQITRSIYKMVQSHIPVVERSKFIREIREQAITAISSAISSSMSLPTDPDPEALIRGIKSEMIESWLACGGCELLKGERAMQKFLDKLCIGTHTAVLVKRLCAEFIIARVRQFLENPKSGGLTEEAELKIVARSIETVLRDQVYKAGRVDQRQRYSIN